MSHVERLGALDSRFIGSFLPCAGPAGCSVRPQCQPWPEPESW
jgi:hypothetical protein